MDGPHYVFEAKAVMNRHGPAPKSALQTSGGTLKHEATGHGDQFECLGAGAALVGAGGAAVASPG